MMGFYRYFSLGVLIFLGTLLLAPQTLAIAPLGSQSPVPGPVLVISIHGPINPATDDYLKTSIEHAKAVQARLLIVELNTPGGLLNSMQTMVERMLSSPVPIAVYVTPSGGSATSAGVFITLAGHVAAMAPGTTIGAAHPVTGTGQDVGGDMREKIENFAVSLITAISQQRGRNVKWAEQAVRESVSITDREAVDKKVVDFVASDIDKLLQEAEGRTVTVNSTSITLTGLSGAPREVVEMSFRQMVVNTLSDPNIAILLGLAAMLGIGLELYHPGGFLPGIVGVICLILSLTSAQVLPIDYGGVALLMLGGIFFVVETFMPSFGLWGIAGIVCMVLGSIYFIDTDLVWSAGGYQVDRWLVGSLAGTTGSILLAVSFLVAKSSNRPVSTGQEGLVSKVGTVKTAFEPDASGYVGRIHIMGEIWLARSSEQFNVGEKAEVVSVEKGLVVQVRRPT